MDTPAKRVVSQAGAVLLVATAGRVGLDRALSAALVPWRKQWGGVGSGEDPVGPGGQVAIGGDCQADVAVLRSEPAVYGRVASDPAVSRLVDALAALAAIDQARAAVRGRV